MAETTKNLLCSKAMEIFDIQIMLHDGSLAGYQVKNARSSDVYEVYQQDKLIALFTSKPDGSWDLTENPGPIDNDLQQRLINQLNGLRY